MKKLKKTFLVLFNVFLILSALSTVLATTQVGPVPITPKTDGTEATTVISIGNQLIGILQVIGIIIAVIILIVLGIKYMMGSAEEKAEYKKTLVPYLVGALLIFGAASLAGVVFKWVQSLTSVTP